MRRLCGSWWGHYSKCCIMPCIILINVFVSVQYLCFRETVMLVNICNALAYLCFRETVMLWLTSVLGRPSCLSTSVNALAYLCFRETVMLWLTSVLGRPSCLSTSVMRWRSASSSRGYRPRRSRAWLSFRHHHHPEITNHPGVEASLSRQQVNPNRLSPSAQMPMPDLKKAIEVM